MVILSFVLTLLPALLATPVLPPALPTPIASTEDKLPPVQFDLDREAEHYTITQIPLPASRWLEASSILELRDGRLAIGTRRGDVFFVTGADLTPPAPEYHLFATGLTEIFGLAHDGEHLYVTQQAEVTRLSDRDGDGRADRFDCVSAGWGFGAEHEFAWGSDFDAEGRIWVALCLSGSYSSDHLFRGWALRIDRDGTTTPMCSGVRSPGGVGFNDVGDPFFTSNQGPWNGACALKHLRPGGFQGHPISFPWYDHAPTMGKVPDLPTDAPDGRLHLDADRIPELVPYALIFPYRKMGQSATAIQCDRSGGRFGPFEGQVFVTDYTLSLVMRAQLEQIDGVYQGACFPFREGLSTGIIGAVLTREGQLFAGGSNRGWPTRGTSAYALERVDFNGDTPFEVHSIHILPDGFEFRFTAPVAAETASALAAWDVSTFTYIYQRFYGSPEVDHTTPTVRSVEVSSDGLSVRIQVPPVRGHVHEFHLPELRDRRGRALLHDAAYYTVNRIPKG